MADLTKDGYFLSTRPVGFRRQADIVSKHGDAENGDVGLGDAVSGGERPVRRDERCPAHVRPVLLQRDHEGIGVCSRLRAADDARRWQHHDRGGHTFCPTENFPSFPVNTTTPVRVPLSKTPPAHRPGARPRPSPCHPHYQARAPAAPPSAPRSRRPHNAARTPFRRPRNISSPPTPSLATARPRRRRLRRRQR